MRWRRLWPVCGAFTGGITGAVIGLLVGSAIAAASLPDPPDDRLAPHESAPALPFRGLILLRGLPTLLVGAVTGVAVGAVGGAVLGSWVGTRFMGGRRTPPPEPGQGRGTDGTA